MRLGGRGLLLLNRTLEKGLPSGFGIINIHFARSRGLQQFFCLFLGIRVDNLDSLRSCLSMGFVTSALLAQADCSETLKKQSQDTLSRS